MENTHNTSMPITNEGLYNTHLYHQNSNNNNNNTNTNNNNNTNINNINNPEDDD